MKLDVREIVVLDFETYWDKDYTLSKMPTSEYVLDDQFYPHCVSIREGIGGCARVVWEDEIDEVLSQIDWANRDLLAHNTAFDGFILTQRYEQRPRRYLDTLSMARGILGLTKRNNLGAVAQRFCLGNKESQVLESTKGMAHIPPELREDFAKYCAGDALLCERLFVMLSRQLPARELDLIDLTLRMFCEPVLHVDCERANNELKKELSGKVRALLLAGVRGEQLLSNHKFAALLEEYDVDPPTKISPTTNKITYAFAKTDLGLQDLLRHPDPQVRLIVEARLRVKSTIGETRAKRLIEAGADGQALPVLLNYCGAHTTRWSAGNKMNLQNLPRPEYDDAGNVIEGTGELRRSIIAPPGCVIVVCDSGQIEARVNAWLAGQEDILEQFRKGEDVYRYMASKIFEVPIEQVTKMQRQVGKVCVLALGYKMSGPRLQHTALNGKPPLDLKLEFCDEVVDAYRGNSKDIVKWWGACGNILKQMCLGVKLEMKGEYKCLRWGKGFIKLPTGLCLLYDDIQADWGHTMRYTYRIHGGRTEIYDGLLCENIVQALARCIVAEQMLEISRQYKVVTMSHDEVVAVAGEGQAQACFDYMSEMMLTPPTWAPDLPLKVSGGWDVSYSK